MPIAGMHCRESMFFHGFQDPHGHAGDDFPVFANDGPVGGASGDAGLHADTGA